ncbi:enoyl-CoA hydratase/isomerase family protein [Bradyrhizobium sp. 33ap4]|uniref:enoyl-CoA hydratase/isomerase family protein n=1 Tax=Bradyrhizobium sp. 33ap4 TaxID=3061630 RepID=UPI00292F1737|nr:enoyl-CoA hydratase/isomerase family protein [Bradyrhizobium sp. 33ap4]
MTYSTILYEVDDRVARITFNRPKRMNAISLEVAAEVEDAVSIADADPDVRVIVIAGAGGRAFSAGHDFDDEDNEKRSTLEGFKNRLNKDVAFDYSVFNCSKPVIAMIDGYCLGGALPFALMCDLRYCSEGSRFGVSETRFGLAPPTLALPWVIGQRCRELIYTGDMFDAQEALRLGMVNRVFPKDQLEDEVMRIAKRMSRVALPTLVWNKRALNNTLLASGFESAMRYGTEACLLMKFSDSEFKRFGEIVQSEGVTAAIKWRDAIFAPFESEKSWASSRTLPNQPVKAK